MKISMNWLADYLPGPLEAEVAAEALTHGGLPVESIETIDGDSVLDVEVTSNRGDCLSHLGIARELSALLGRPFQEPAISAPEAADRIQSLTSITIEAPELCPHYTARLLRGVKIGPSPQWMVQRLEAVGLRSINNVVDVTNYVLFELGQPLHAFDFDRLTGRRIIVRAARAGEKLTSLDGHERALTAGMLVIADADRPVALAGVMGGLETEVTDSTRNLLLESARFEPLSIRQTARALAMASDSSYRFERGIDPTLPERASLRAAQLILQTAGGELLSGQATAGQSGYRPKTLALRLGRLKQVLGVELPVDRVMQALSRLQMSPLLQADQIAVTVPSWRLDVNLEIDLVEEVARVIGYEAIPIRDEISIRLTPPDPSRRTLEIIRSALVAAGYYEAVTFSFVSDALADDFIPAEAKTLARADARVRSADAHLRPSILPGLLEAVGRNENAGTASARLFEIGSTFWHDPAGRMDERRRLALVGSPDLREVRGVIETLLGQLDDTRPVRIVPDQRKGFARGAAGRIEWGGKPVGFLGKIDKAVAGKLSLRAVPAAAELELEALLSGAQHVPQLRPLPRFPAVRRDLSLIVPERLRYEQIQSLVRELKPAAMEELEYVTTYRGKPLEKGTKSITITLIFRSPNETLTSEAVEGAVAKVVAAAQERLNATLRV
jgi:phenylalanyl-tRNA synthetase beta chain